MSYIVLINDEEKGPYSIEELMEYVNQGLIKSDTLARFIDSGEWWEVSAILYQYQKIDQTLPQKDSLLLNNSSTLEIHNNKKNTKPSDSHYSKPSLKIGHVEVYELLSHLLIIVRKYISGFKYESHASYLLVAIIVFFLTVNITNHVAFLFTDLFLFWFSGSPLPSSFGLVFLVADYIHLFVFFGLCLIALSIIANRNILNQNINKFYFTNNYFFSSRFHINFFCRCFAIILIAISIILLFACFGGSLFCLRHIEKEFRQPVISSLYGDGATIVTTINGTKKFAPDKIHLLLRNKISALNSAGNHGMGVVSYKNVMCKYNAAENREEWFFEVEIKQNNAPPLLYKCNAFNGKSDCTLDVELVDKSPSLAN